MKKKNKYGINSGNSFSFGACKSILRRNAKHQEVIVKTMSHKHVQPQNSQELNNRIVKESSKLIDDGNLDGNIDHNYFFSRNSYYTRTLITYTINKRKRWLIKDNILGAIDSLQDTGEHENEKQEKETTNFKVTFCERKLFSVPIYSYYHKLTHDCVAYHDSAAKLPHTYPASHCSYETDLRRIANDNTGKNSKLEKQLKRKANHNVHFRDVQRKVARRKEVLTKKAGTDDAFDNWALRMHPPQQQRDQNITPEIHYEICSQHPWVGHKAFYDEHNVSVPGYGELDGFKKAKKKRRHARAKSPDGNNSYTVHELQQLRKTWSEEDCTVLKISKKYAHYKIADQNNINYNEQESKRHKLEDTEVDTMFEKRSSLTVEIKDILKTSVNKTKQAKYSSKKKRSKQSEVKCLWHGLVNGHLHKYGKNEAKYFGKVFEPTTTTTTEVNEIISDNISLVHEEEHLPPICISVAKSSICEKNLEKVFASSYYESYSIPRVFMVNVSQYYAENSEKGAMKSCVSRDFIDDIYLVVKVGCLEKENNSSNASNFRVDGDWEIVDESIQVGLTVEGNFEQMEKTGIMTRLCSYLDNYTTMEPISIKELTHNLICSLTKKYQLRLSGPEASHKNKNQQSQMQSLYDYVNKPTWKIDIYQLLETYQAVKDLPLPYNKTRLKKMHSISGVTSKDGDIEMCEICFMTPHNDLNVTTTGTSLKSCQHWYCNSCWREHITQAINNGALHLECPGYECDSVIDSATLMSVAGFKLYNKHWLHQQNYKVDIMPDWKWCPQTTCHRAVHVQAFNNTRYTEKENGDITDPSGRCVCVKCDCTSAWCFDCQQEPHWPITCDAAKMYIKLVKQRGTHDNKALGEIFYVDVKKCPRCKYPIEKNMGCQHMVCKCGHSFCWECLGEWSSHGSTLGCPKSRVALTSMALENPEDDINNSEYFITKALQCRAWKMKLNQNHSGILLKRIYSIERKFLRNNFWWKDGTYFWKLRDENKDRYEEYMNVFQEYKLKLYMICHILEFSYGLLGLSRKASKTPGLLSELNVLEFIFNRLHDILYTRKTNSVSGIVTNFSKSYEKAIPVLKRITMKMKKL